jgi:hypothetical protein
MKNIAEQKAKINANYLNSHKMCFIEITGSLKHVAIFAHQVSS